jgi:ATP-dependent DNA ligase
MGFAASLFAPAARRSRGEIGQLAGALFPEVGPCLPPSSRASFVIDGELAIPVGGTLSFDALQMRIHPAESRIKKLAAETPAILILFDMLLDTKGKSLIEAPLTKRRAALERFFKAAGQAEGLKLSPYTLERDEARRWLDDARGAIDGVIAKETDGPYLPGCAPCLAEVVAHRRLRGRRLPLCDRESRSRVAAARSLQ